MKKEERQEFYSIDKLIASDLNAKYYVGYGERSNGKTYQVLHLMLFGFHKKVNGTKIDWNGFLDDESQGAIVRRYDEDFRGGNGQKYFKAFYDSELTGNLISERTKGKYNYIQFRNGEWRLCHVNDDGEIDLRHPKPFCYKYSINAVEHSKGGSDDKVRYILFDEFIARTGYLVNEFENLMNVFSTIIRQRDNVRIFFMGNTVNKYCPYFNDMGLFRVKTQRQGTIDVYRYGDSPLEIAVEFTDSPTKKKKSDVYFAFDNPKLKMITSGAWEIDIYPHCPIKFFQCDIQYIYLIKFDDELLQCEIVYRDDRLFTFIHRKTSEIQKDKFTVIYQQDYNPLPNYTRRINKPRTTLEQRIWSFFVNEQVYYQDNEVGEVVRNYLIWCKS